MFYKHLGGRLEHRWCVSSSLLKIFAAGKSLQNVVIGAALSHRCEHRMRHIPFKPLSERMLQEPFWLGLITVTVVLGIIGLVWCAKRHFPEKLEKLLAEEADRNRPRICGQCMCLKARDTAAYPSTNGISVHHNPKLLPEHAMEVLWARVLVFLVGLINNYIGKVVTPKHKVGGAFAQRVAWRCTTVHPFGITPRPQ
uniref:(California timema) hypothetical protein n=1 Tax=Timema californicum TaxID=61474 RepID=A0A7R9P9I8_TIMCA|nr:unnamed protein product [Timema californicum]